MVEFIHRVSPSLVTIALMIVSLNTTTAPARKCLHNFTGIFTLTKGTGTRDDEKLDGPIHVSQHFRSVDFSSCIASGYLVQINTSHLMCASILASFGGISQLNLWIEVGFAEAGSPQIT